MFWLEFLVGWLVLVVFCAISAACWLLVERWPKVMPAVFLGVFLAILGSIVARYLGSVFILAFGGP